MPLPDYMIIGETKCGTTSFYNYLIKHPKIIDTYGNGDQLDPTYSTKEIRFFDRYYAKGLDWYKRCFPDTKPDEITGEATPMYMYRATALHRIHKVLPDIKLIVMLRNPVDRLYSNFQHAYKWIPGWKQKYSSFESFLNSAHDVDYYMIEKGLYYYTLLKWFRLFPRRQFHIFSLEEMMSNPQAAYTRTLKFLGVEAFQLSEFKVFRKLYYSDITNSVRGELVDFYYPYNQMLYELLEKNFDWDK